MKKRDTIPFPILLAIVLAILGKMAWDKLRKPTTPEPTLDLIEQNGK